MFIKVNSYVHKNPILVNVSNVVKIVPFRDAEDGSTIYMTDGTKIAVACPFEKLSESICYISVDDNVYSFVTTEEGSCAGSMDSSDL